MHDQWLREAGKIYIKVNFERVEREFPKMGLTSWPAAAADGP